jgi:hypothetical protein
MGRASNIAYIVAGLFALLGGGLLLAIGAVVFGFGVAGLFAGVHGGPITAALMMLVGSVPLFIGYHLGRHGFRTIRERNRAHANSI